MYQRRTWKVLKFPIIRQTVGYVYYGWLNYRNFETHYRNFGSFFRNFETSVENVPGAVCRNDPKFL